jgi:hypothetical protein
MFDFGSIMGSGTTAPDVPRSGHAYLMEQDASLRALASFGLWAPEWAKRPRPAFAPSAGPFTAEAPFNPATWRAEYPNAAFQNMRADDAFWAARRVAAFSDHQIALLVARGRYRDPAASTQVAAALKARRDRIARVWLPAVTPLVSPALTSSGRLTFDNAAVSAGVAARHGRYRAQWSRFDNGRREHTRVGDVVSSDTPVLPMPPALLTADGYVAAAVSVDHPDYPHWTRPVIFYFERTRDGWRSVGLVRDVPPRDDAEHSPDE